MAVQGFFSRLSSNRAHWSLAPKVCPGWLGNLSLLIEIICWAPYILQVQSTGLPSIFLGAQPFICNTISREPHMMNMEEEWSSASSKGRKKSPQLILLVYSAFDTSRCVQIIQESCYQLSEWSQFIPTTSKVSMMNFLIRKFTFSLWTRLLTLNTICDLPTEGCFRLGNPCFDSDFRTSMYFFKMECNLSNPNANSFLDFMLYGKIAKCKY